MGNVTCRKAKNMRLDIVDLFQVGEVILAEYRDGEVLTIVTSRGRKVGISPDGWFGVLSGPEFRYGPADPPEYWSRRWAHGPS